MNCLRRKSCAECVPLCFGVWVVLVLGGYRLVFFGWGSTRYQRVRTTSVHAVRFTATWMTVAEASADSADSRGFKQVFRHILDGTPGVTLQQVRLVEPQTLPLAVHVFP